jgi:putative DNA primase/helicase
MIARMTEQHIIEATTEEHTLVAVEPIPHPLKRRPQWVNWCLEERDAELTKVPYTPDTLKRARSNDLMTWGTFEEAVDALETKPGRYSGIGFVFCSGDPYTGIDLDHVRDPDTGDLAEWAVAIIDTFEDAYKEVSPSGRGVHIITRGKVKEPRKIPGLEIYSMERFFTVTGRVL